MADGELDGIHIRDLRFPCIIGVDPQERRARQEVVVNITLYADLRAAGASDRIEDTVDYSAVKHRVLAMGEASSFHLAEALAERVAAICLAQDGVRRVRVRVDKPAALRGARAAGVEILRPRDRP
jgi:FolB domain-containing protein